MSEFNQERVLFQTCIQEYGALNLAHLNSQYIGYKSGYIHNFTPHILNFAIVNPYFKTKQQIHAEKLKKLEEYKKQIVLLEEDLKNE